MKVLLEPASVRAGDIILILSPGKGPSFNLLGQTLLRIPSIAWRKSHNARYSHVMLGIFPGVVIHADGKTVKMEKLTDAIGNKEFERESFRVVRLVNPALDEALATRLVAEVRLFLNQRYSFRPGRRSSKLMRLATRGHRLTFPFCSELIATAYAAVGLPLCHRPPDRTLPVDVEVHCVPPAWKDVSEEYVAQPIPAATTHEYFPFVSEIAGALDKAEGSLRAMWDNQIEMANVIHKLAHDAIVAFVAKERLKSKELDKSKYFAMHPSLLFQEHAETTRQCLASLPEFYEEIQSGLKVEPNEFADLIEKLLPEIEHDRRAFESLPTLQSLRKVEPLGAFMAFSAKALRLETILRSIAIGIKMPLVDSENRFASISEELVAPFLSQVPVLEDEEAEKLLKKVDEFVIPDDNSSTSDARRLCGMVVRLHSLLSIVVSASSHNPL